MQGGSKIIGNVERIVFGVRVAMMSTLVAQACCDGIAPNAASESTGRLLSGMAIGRVGCLSEVKMPRLSNKLAVRVERLNMTSTTCLLKIQQ